MENLLTVAFEAHSDEHNHHPRSFAPSPIGTEADRLSLPIGHLQRRIEPQPVRVAARRDHGTVLRDCYQELIPIQSNTRNPMAKRKNVLTQKSQVTSSSLTADFDAVVTMIRASRTQAIAAVNTTIIDLYWRIGEYVHGRIAANAWGQSTVEQLAGHIQNQQPGVTGFSTKNLWRMRQFFEAYDRKPKLSPLVRELPWTHNLMILNRCKREDEREFYLRICRQERWSKRELERQLDGALFERVALSPAKLSAPLTELHPDAASVFRDSYLVEFLQLPAPHAEVDLQRGLVAQLQRFLLELGRDYCFIGSQYPLQVGGKDFALDLLFFNRALNALVGIELKVGEFQPSHLGQLEFYLEALDRDVKKPHEGPSIGVLLCASKDAEVVEYALSRAVSPALVAEYRTQLPDKKLLQAKLHEFYQLAQDAYTENQPPKTTGRRSRKPAS
jgi:predicted nuclease of restriction endonuclease-like (RecB) superfamily